MIACERSSPTEPSPRLFTIRACDNETFRVRINDPIVAAEAAARLGKGTGRVLTGRLLRGDGGFNAPWGWHLDPSAVAFADATIELCDGCPSHLQENLDYWIDTVRHFCPWSAEVIAAH